jgi:hypothetical protein
VYNAVPQQWSSCLQIIENNGDVTSMACSADGAHIGSAVSDIIHIWDAFTGTKLQPFQGHSNDVWSITFSLDGKHLVSGSKDKTVRIWELLLAQKSTHYRGILGMSVLWDFPPMENMLCLDPLTTLFAPGMLLLEQNSAHSKGILMRLIMWDFPLMEDILCLDPMMKLFASGMVLPAMSSTHFKGIQDQSYPLCSPLMEIILPLDLRTALFSFGMFLLGLSSRHSKGIQT